MPARVNNETGHQKRMVYTNSEVHIIIIAMCLPDKLGRRYRSFGTPGGHPAVRLGLMRCEFHRDLKLHSASFRNLSYTNASACLHVYRVQHHNNVLTEAHEHLPLYGVVWVKLSLLD